MRDENDNFTLPVGCVRARCSGVVSKPSVEALVDTLLDGLDASQLTFARLQSTTTSVVAGHAKDTPGL